MSPKELILENLAVVSESAPDVVGRFYAKLFERHPELRSLFGRRSQAAQEKMVLDALVAVADHVEDAAWLEQTLRPLGAKHLSYGVRDFMYPLVADVLIATLREATGAGWNDGIERAWGDALGAVAGLMIAGAKEAEGAPTNRTASSHASP